MMENDVYLLVKYKFLKWLLKLAGFLKKKNGLPEGRPPKPNKSISNYTLTNCYLTKGDIFKTYSYYDTNKYLYNDIT